MTFAKGLFGGDQGMGWEAERAASAGQADELYKQQQEKLAGQQAFTTALQAQTPGAIAAQQQLLGQYQQQALGQGPSVASRQLASTTGKNIAQTAALMGGARGASADPGAMAQRIAQAGAETQQQAAGQAATLRAQEQLAAQNAISGLTAQQLGQVQGAQQLGLQSTEGAQRNVMGAIAARNEVQQKMEAEKAKKQGGIMSGLFGAAGTMLGGPLGSDAGSAIGGLMGGAHGGIVEVEKPYAVGGYVDQLMMAEGGAVPAMLSPGERYLPPVEVAKVEQGKKEPINAGKKIPGKASVPGDSLKNDTVKMNLQEGGIVIPRSVMNSKDPAEQARKFVAAIVAKRGLKRK